MAFHNDDDGDYDVPLYNVHSRPCKEKTITKYTEKTMVVDPVLNILGTSTFFVFRHKLEKRRAQCIAVCQQELPSNSKSPSSLSSPPSGPSSSVKLGQEAPQAPAFSDAVLLHHHPEKGRHGVRKTLLRFFKKC